jgi:hypothetical protein
MEWHVIRIFTMSRQNTVTNQNPPKFIESKMVFINLKRTVLIITWRQQLYILQGVEGLFGPLLAPRSAKMPILVARHETRFVQRSLPSR